EYPGPTLQLAATTPDSAITTYQPKITDFGLAKFWREQDGPGRQAKRTGIVLGTPSYMAPEQAGGRVREIGPATDVYALGAILYECLTGGPPFRGKSALETLDLLRTAEPVPPSRHRPGVPAGLDDICLECLEKHPAN